MEELTKEEIKFLIDRCFRKQIRLEDAGLEDAACYMLSITARRKLEKMLKEIEKKQFTSERK